MLNPPSTSSSQAEDGSTELHESAEEATVVLASSHDRTTKRARLWSEPARHWQTLVVVPLPPSESSIDPDKFNHEFPPLPFAPKPRFPSSKSSLIIRQSPSDLAIIGMDRTILRFSNRHEVSEMYQQLVDLKGWSEEEERANWEEGFIRSKRTFVESQLPALRRMGFRKIPTQEELGDYITEFLRGKPTGLSRCMREQLREHGVEYC